MSQILKSTFDNSKGYIFDADDIKIVANRVELVPVIIGAEAAIYTKLDDNKGLVAVDSSGNEQHGAFQGGYTENNWTPGKINSAIIGISTSSGFVNFDQLLEYERDEPFTLECWFNTTSGSTMSFVSKQSDSGNFQGFAINFAGGKPRFVIRDDVGNILAAETTATYNDGLWHHVVMTYNGNNSHTGMTIFIDNVNDTVVTTTGTLTGSIKTTADLQISGRDGNNICIDANTKIDEVVIYSRELNAAEVNFRWNSGNGTQDLPGSDTSYPTDNPPIQPVIAQLITEITAFSADITATGSDNVFFVLEINGADYWWNGISWVISSGSSESNTYQDINDNLISLVLDGLSSFNWKGYMHSATGDTTPFLNFVEITYAIELQDPTLNQSIISGIRLGLDGNPKEGEVIKVNSRWLIGENTEIDNDQIETITNVEGKWQISLNYEDLPPDYLEWYFGVKYYKTNFIQGIIKFSQLTIIEEN